jgi:hypothetical protein
MLLEAADSQKSAARFVTFDLLEPYPLTLLLFDECGFII